MAKLSRELTRIVGRVEAGGRAGLQVYRPKAIKPVNVPGGPGQQIDIDFWKRPLADFAPPAEAAKGP